MTVSKLRGGRLKVVWKYTNSVCCHGDSLEARSAGPAGTTRRAISRYINFIIDGLVITELEWKLNFTRLRAGRPENPGWSTGKSA